MKRTKKTIQLNENCEVINPTSYISILKDLMQVPFGYTYSEYLWVMVDFKYMDSFKPNTQKKFIPTCNYSLFEIEIGDLLFNEFGYKYKLAD